jgi:hypothetical protein
VNGHAASFQCAREKGEEIAGSVPRELWPGLRDAGRTFFFVCVISSESIILDCAILGGLDVFLGNSD